MKEEVGACSICCGYCPAFRLRENRCLGCEWANKLLRKAREGEKGCVFFECARIKDLECCFQCKEFPCKIHYDSEHAVYTRQALDMWKELGRTGLTFWGKREELEESSRARGSLRSYLQQRDWRKP